MGFCVKFFLIFIMQKMYMWGPVLYFSQGLSKRLRGVYMCVCVCTSACAQIFTSHAVSSLRTVCFLSITRTNGLIWASVHDFNKDLNFQRFQLKEGDFPNRFLRFSVPRCSLLFPEFQEAKKLILDFFNKFSQCQTWFRILLLFRLLSLFNFLFFKFIYLF